MIEKIVSPFDKSEVSDAVVCLRPKKNMAGAIVAPMIEDVISRRQQYLLLENEESDCNDVDDALFLSAIIALKDIADNRQTKDESKNGSTVDNTGFAIVDTEPKRAAAMIAAVNLMATDFCYIMFNQPQCDQKGFQSG